MDNYAGEGRREAASISAREVGVDVAKAEMDRPLSNIAEQRQRLSPLLDRIHNVGNVLTNLGDRAYGERPTNAKGDDVRKSPPYGGEMCELFYVIDRVEDAVDKLERAAARIDGLA